MRDEQQRKPLTAMGRNELLAEIKRLELERQILRRLANSDAHRTVGRVIKLDHDTADTLQRTGSVIVDRESDSTSFAVPGLRYYTAVPRVNGAFCPGLVDVQLNRDDTLTLRRCSAELHNPPRILFGLL